MVEIIQSWECLERTSTLDSSHRIYIVEGVKVVIEVLVWSIHSCADAALVSLLTIFIRLPNLIAGARVATDADHLGPWNGTLYLGADTSSMG